VRTLSVIIGFCLLAGCSDRGTGPVDEPLTPATTETIQPLPPPITIVGRMQAGLGPPGPATEETSCFWTTVACQFHVFRLPRNATVTVILEWEMAAADLELYLTFQDNEKALESSTKGTSTHEWLRLELGRGSYEAVVASWASVDTPYTLRVFFDEPRATNP
jgi:hypothetical protein